MSRIHIAIIAVLVLYTICAECQLTFSPDWGKRSVGNSANNGNTASSFFDIPQGNCKTSKEMLLEIFRFVQSEAQLFIDCKHRE